MLISQIKDEDVRIAVIIGIAYGLAGAAIAAAAAIVVAAAFGLTYFLYIIPTLIFILILSEIFFWLNSIHNLGLFEIKQFEIQEKMNTPNREKLTLFNAPKTRGFCGKDNQEESKKKGFVRQLDFREAFVWEKEIEDFVKERIQGYSLNVPCGSSQLGDIRLDLDPNLSMRGAYDFFKDELNFPDNTFDTIISDPPWKVGHYFRPKLFFKLVEKCKIGGTIIYNATWIPTSKYVKLKECWIKQSSQFSNVSIISVFEKIAEVPKT